ncbi:MAG: response regulator [Pseudomonadota bacterium]
MYHILLMEDDPDLGPLMRAALEDAGCQVELVVDATSAVAEFERSTPDVFVADIIIKRDGRPIADGGIKAIWRINSIAKARRIKVGVIAISGALRGEGTRNLLTTAQQIGAHDVLEKPFHPDELLAKIETVLAALST